MFTLSNALSLLRAPLAILFLVNNPILRAIVVVAACLTDSVDGYLARKYKYTTKLGAILDPVMDKFFVFFVLGILLIEGGISPWQITAFLSRDIALFLFALVVLSRGLWKTYNYRSMWWGKVTTALQFPVLFLLSLHIYIPSSLFIIFYIFGFGMLCELFFHLEKQCRNELNLYSKQVIVSSNGHLVCPKTQ